MFTQFLDSELDDINVMILQLYIFFFVSKDTFHSRKIFNPQY